MDDTIHAAFVAGTGITVGVSIIFTSFLLRLLLESSPEVPEVVDDSR
jgi:hypothetical protein